MHIMIQLLVNGQALLGQNNNKAPTVISIPLPTLFEEYLVYNAGNYIKGNMVGWNKSVSLPSRDFML